MIQFVFCHGFGYDLHYFNHLAPYFAQYECYFIDLGYFNKPIKLPKLKKHKTIAIGHSFGLVKLVQMFENFDSLIGLGSFSNFLGQDQTLREIRQRELRSLQLSFMKNPISTLTNFYSRCGVAEYIDRANNSKLNLDLILADIELLTTNYTLPNVATLILTSDDDPIVPKSIILDNFSKQAHVHIESITGLKHSYGYTQPFEVYKKIIRFLHVNPAK